MLAAPPGEGEPISPWLAVEVVGDLDVDALGLGQELLRFVGLDRSRVAPMPSVKKPSHRNVRAAMRALAPSEDVMRRAAHLVSLVFPSADPETTSRLRGGRPVSPAHGRFAERVGGQEPAIDDFAHPAERYLAELYDEHGIRWDYEPHLFPLEHGPDGRIAQAIRPDFYLPDLDVYVECTVMRERTPKNRKLKKLRERYGVVVTCLDGRDFRRLGLALA